MRSAATGVPILHPTRAAPDAPTGEEPDARTNAQKSLRARAEDAVVPRAVPGMAAVPADGPTRAHGTGKGASRGFDRIGRLVRGLWTVALLGALVGAAIAEGRTFFLQSAILSRLAAEMTYRVEPGRTPQVPHFTGGPYDERLGYDRIPRFLDTLAAAGFAVTGQARVSPRLAAFLAQGGYPIYREKTQSGLTLLDRDGTEIWSARVPARVYRDFEEIPPLVVAALLFIENRELLDPTHPRRNPAIEWDRLAAAIVGQAAGRFDPSLTAGGGSTLATQMEKFRHSPGGRTHDAGDKFHQVASASLRAYLDGPDTREARRRIVTDYLNSTPLSARPGYGEVIGIGDGLWVWFGADLAEVNRLLAMDADTRESLPARARAFKQVLSLLLAQRRPTHFLIGGRAELAALADGHIRLLAKAGVLTPAFRDAALAADLQFRADTPQPPAISYLDAKATAAVRARLAQMLDLPNLYALDRLDLTARTTLDRDANAAVADVLRNLTDPAALTAFGLVAPRLLDRGDPAKVIYSVTVYERAGAANLLRVQADSLDQPLDINEGAKLDLGSTAKLRTLVTYLETVNDLYLHLRPLSRSDLLATAERTRDPLTKWAARFLAGDADLGLPDMLEAAMQRRYSANPNETFFTGGGAHRFVNFDRADNGKVLSVLEAFRGSVNLVFIRLMRDVVAYHTAQIREESGDPIGQHDHPARTSYLARFADIEGKAYLNRFYRGFAGQTPDEILAATLRADRRTPRHLAIVFRSVRPSADFAAFARFLAATLPGAAPGIGEAKALYDKFDPARLSLTDRAYLAGVHPLKLWLASYLQEHPGATRGEILTAGAMVRQDAYAWLFRTSRKRAQDTRIRILVEQEAFQRIHRAWQRLGYPFDSLVPSYATAIGSSGDRPSALAELVGILLNDGLRRPRNRIEQLHFATGTPHEAHLAYRPGAIERVLSPEVAAAARRALIDNVDAGTGRRVHGAFLAPDGAALPTGGKTGTGDHRFETYAPGGRLIESRVVSRTATFVFIVGDRLFGTITAYVPGPEAANYEFTSALPVQLLKILAPALQPLLARPLPASGTLGAG